jgi:hypothetical protein
MLSGEVRIQPGFPSQWDHASIRHHDFEYSWKLSGKLETYSITPRFGKPAALRLISAARADGIASVTVNGQTAKWNAVDSAVGTPRIEIVAAASPRFDVKIEWNGAKVASVSTRQVAAIGDNFTAQFSPAELEEVADPQKMLTNVHKTSNTFGATVTGTVGHHTVFAKVRQGQLRWWLPVDFESRPPLEVIAAAEQKQDRIVFRLRNNTGQALGPSTEVIVGGQVIEQPMHLAAGAESSEISIPLTGLLPGGSRVDAGFANGPSAEGLATNWNIRSESQGWDEVDLTSAFNDRVTQIFRNEYLSPRSPYASLSIPKQGIGGWSAKDATAEIDDSGLRSVSRSHNGIIMTSQGIPFRTPGEPEVKNILFTSQWDNYPHEKSVALAGKAAHIYLLMAGSTNAMQSRMDNGEVVVTYSDGSLERLALQNPTTWWPIDQDYLIDDYQFPLNGPLPPRVDLRTGKDRIPSRGHGEPVHGGSATVLDLPLDRSKELKSLTVRALANEVVIGLMSVTLAR